MVSNMATPTTPFKNGQAVTLAIMSPGGPSDRIAGQVRGIILNTGRYESDVMLVPDDDNIEDARDLLAEEGLPLDDLREGPVYVLRNMNNEWLTVC